MRAVVQAAGFILFHRAQPASFLLMKHRDRWDLPKGHAEEGEDLLTTALRETEEETGIRSSQIEIDSGFRYSLEYPVVGKKRGSYLKRATYFLGYVTQKHEITLTEHLGYKWFEWPVAGSIQAMTIDPLLQALSTHFEHLAKSAEES
ncbi:MAG: NUDIX domain-containing protein [Planctomycetales bacterium]|nr:NUDIX domain-containing protein [Planctomycetales bacterium]